MENCMTEGLEMSAMALSVVVVEGCEKSLMESSDS